GGEDTVGTDVFFSHVAAGDDPAAFIQDEERRNAVAAELLEAGERAELIVIDRQPGHMGFLNVGLPGESGMIATDEDQLELGMDRRDPLVILDQPGSEFSTW